MKKLLLALVTVMGLAFAPIAQASHSWGNYHWSRASNPFALKIVDSVTGTWDSLLPAVSADWSASSVLDTSIEPGSTSLLQRLQCNPVAGKIRVCNANYGPNFWFGIAQVWLNGAHIRQATTKVNDFYFTGTYGNNIARRHVLCQEIGHDFGLDHQHGAPSCMEDNNSTLNTPSYLSPNSHDYAQLQTIYTHLDVGAKVGSSGQSGSRPSLVQRIGGETVLTYIFWVN
jgi:hypothetical protein